MPALIEPLESRRLLSANVTNFHNDSQSTGLNAAETQLTPADVQVGEFGKIFTTAADGQVYAQPLVMTGVSIAGGSNTTRGAGGTHDVVFVATENDSVYAIDASSSGGSVLWKRSFLDATNPTGDQNNTLGATSITTLASADVGSTDISPVIGITGTPVIDAAHNCLYVVTKTKEVISGVTTFVQRLHAISLSDGTDIATPYVIGTTTGDNNNTTPVYVYGTGDGHVTDPYNATGRQVVQFNALHEAQRTALNLVNGQLYVTWASHGDNGPYHGWVVAWNVSRITTSGFALAGVLNTSPNNGLAGIWEGGGELAFESDGSAFYFVTGNGDGGAPTLGGNGLPTNANYNEAVVKVVADPGSTATSQNANGWGMKISSFFTPYNVTALDAADSDFGSGAPILLPDSAGISGHPHLLVVGGKDGRVYVLDRDNLGGYNATNDAALNSISDGSGHLTPPSLDTGTLSTPAYFNGKLYILSGYNGAAYACVLNSSGQLVVQSQTSIGSFGFLPGSPSVSSNGSSNGIVWLMDRNSNEIRAYDASTLATQLWNSAQASGNADAVGAVVKFAVPTVANGEVFVGTAGSLVVYGLTPPASTAPNAPVLAAADISGTAVNLTWTDPSVSPNTANGYLIEDSTDGVNFTQITTAGAGATSLSVGGLNNNTTYSFRIRGYNAAGNSSYSNVASATTTTGGPIGTAPNTPRGLGAAVASATSVNLNWTDAGGGETGYHLDRATDAGFTTNLITENIPTLVTSDTDTATGLAPGLTFYYRLRAYNDAGDSGNSNTVSVSIPIAPPKPTLQSITRVTPYEIDMTWQDNAGHAAQGYHILRSITHGSFSIVASLPPTSRTPPSSYGWNDTGLSPGTYYEYHIEAYNVSGNNDFAGVNATTLPLAPARRLTIAATGPGNISLSWAAVAGAVSYNIYRGTSPGGESRAPLAAGVSGTSFSDAIAPPGVAVYYKIAAVNANAAPLPSVSAPSIELSVTTPLLPRGWRNNEIGAPPLRGSASASNGTFTVASSGSVIGNTADQFDFTNATTSGDRTLTAAITGTTNTSTRAQTGIMLRDTAAASAPFAALLWSPNNTLNFVWRSTPGAPAARAIVAAIPTPGRRAPLYLRLLKSGNRIAAFYSTDGSTWTQIGFSRAVTFSSANYLAGMAVTSANARARNTSTFADVVLA